MFFQWNPVFIDFWQNFQWVMNMALCFVFQPFFYFACLIKTCGSIHTKFHVLVMSQSWDISFWTCYKKCVHTLSHLRHTMFHRKLCKYVNLQRFSCSMILKSMKFCAYLLIFRLLRKGIIEILILLWIEPGPARNVSTLQKTKIRRFWWLWWL